VLGGSASASDVDISLRFRTDKVAVGGNLFMYAVARRNGTNEYRVKLRLAANGQVFASASMVVNNVESLIGSEVLVPGLTHTANTLIAFRAQVTGSGPTTLRVRAWLAANAEPTTWHYTSTNSNAALQGAGLFGLRSYMSSSRHQRAGRDDLRRLPRHLTRRAQPATGLQHQLRRSDRRRGRRHQLRRQRQ
jgi:hypothetical protein